MESTNNTIDDKEQAEACLDKQEVAAAKCSLEKSEVEDAALKDIIDNDEGTAERIEAAKQLLQERTQKELDDLQQSVVDQAQNLLEKTI